MHQVTSSRFMRTPALRPRRRRRARPSHRVPRAARC
jgi:hypothetical protein